VRAPIKRCCDPNCNHARRVHKRGPCDHARRGCYDVGCTEQECNVAFCKCRSFREPWHEEVSK
jgi:hypothetical protein